MMQGWAVVARRADGCGKGRGVLGVSRGRTTWAEFWLALYLDVSNEEKEEA